MTRQRAFLYSATVVCLAIAVILRIGIATVPARAASHIITSNPYKGKFGPPNCTWYAWQRLHDVEHLDLQFTDDAGNWIEQVQEPNAIWSERANLYVGVQIATTPSQGDIVVLPYPNVYWANPSHVAFVEKVSNNGTFDVTEQNYADLKNPTSQPYLNTNYRTWNLTIMQQAEQGHARFLHFLTTPGTTSPLSSSADNSQLISATPNVTATPGQDFQVQFTYQNTGTTTWSDNGYALACDTFYHPESNCMGGTTTGFGGQDVATGQQFTFTLNLTAPDAEGTYTTWWDMTHGGSIFGNNNSAVLVTVIGSPPTTNVPSPTNTPAPPPAPIDNSQWISNSPYLTVNPGQQFQVQFTYRNTGTTIWSDNGYALVCDTYYHPESNCMGSGPVGFGGQSVVPGQQFTFTLNLIAPTSTGTYTTWWDMVHNGSIFGNNNSYIQVTDAAPVDNSQWVANSPYLTVSPGQKFSITFTYKNDGTTTWSDGGGFALGCDTYYHHESNCMGSGPVGFNGNTVSPGGQYTFTLLLIAPSSLGTYTTWWDMEHNGGIFGNNNSYVQVSVQ